MTEVSEQMYPVICKYCLNCQDKKCSADVPWYCCSVYCKYFTEEIKERKEKRRLSMKRIMKKALVETF